MTNSDSIVNISFSDSSVLQKLQNGGTDSSSFRLDSESFGLDPEFGSNVKDLFVNVNPTKIIIILYFLILFILVALMIFFNSENKSEKDKIISNNIKTAAIILSIMGIVGLFLSSRQRQSS